jgi:hypothetical protein
MIHIEAYKQYFKSLTEKGWKAIENFTSDDDS